MSYRDILQKVERLWRNRKPEFICGLLCVLVVVAMARLVIRRTLFIETENASLQGYAVALSAEVPGEVLQVYVDENEKVRKGQLLCRLEDTAWRARVEDAEASEAGLRIEWENAHRDAGRAAFLLRHESIPAADYDEARAQADALLGRLQAAAARSAEARENYRRTRIVAPADGIIAFRTARPGLMARPGFPLFGFVDHRARWVLAKVRESDLPDLHVGKPVQVRFDGFPGREFSGKIESLSPTTERSFYSAVPADFSAGNYTKYVQWFPIRIRVALGEADMDRIPIGISSSIHMTRD